MVLPVDAFVVWAGAADGVTVGHKWSSEASATVMATAVGPYNCIFPLLIHSPTRRLLMHPVASKSSPVDLWRRRIFFRGGALQTRKLTCETGLLWLKFCRREGILSYNPTLHRFASYAWCCDVAVINSGAAWCERHPSRLGVISLCWWFCYARRFDDSMQQPEQSPAVSLHWPSSPFRAASSCPQVWQMTADDVWNCFARTRFAFEYLMNWETLNSSATTFGAIGLF